MQNLIGQILVVVVVVSSLAAAFTITRGCAHLPSNCGQAIASGVGAFYRNTAHPAITIVRAARDKIAALRLPSHGLLELFLCWTRRGLQISKCSSLAGLVLRLQEPFGAFVFGRGRRNSWCAQW